MQNVSKLMVPEMSRDAELAPLLSKHWQHRVYRTDTSIVHQNIMSITTNPEAQNDLFEKETAEHLPPNLARAALRLEFPPSYVLVGVYRLFTDKSLYIPAWDKCKHGTRRGTIVGGIWARFISSKLRMWTNGSMHNIGVFHFCLSKEIHWTIPTQVSLSVIKSCILRVHILFGSSPRITGLSRDTMFGYKIPFAIHTCELICYFKQAVHILILSI